MSEQEKTTKRYLLTRDECMGLLGEENLRCCKLASMAAMMQEILVNLSDRSGSADDDKIINGMEFVAETISNELDQVGSNLDRIQAAIEHGEWAADKAA